MNLPFMQKFPTVNMPAHLADSPTLFVEQINNTLAVLGICSVEEIAKYEREYSARFGFDLKETEKMKLHTIREDKNNSWCDGKLIHLCINNRRPNYFRFAPIVKCVSTQSFEVKKVSDTGDVFKDFIVWVDNVFLTPDAIKQLAINDGFNDVNDFHCYFQSDFKGKIIHWTDKRY